MVKFITENWEIFLSAITGLGAWFGGRKLKASEDKSAAATAHSQELENLKTIREMEKQLIEDMRASVENLKAMISDYQSMILQKDTVIKEYRSVIEQQKKNLEKCKISCGMK